MRKRVLLLLAGLAIVSGSAFAGTLSYTNQIKNNDENKTRTQIVSNWTVGKGSYKFDNGSKLVFSAEKDFYHYVGTSTKSDHQGWDTGIGYFVPVDSFEMFGKTFKNEVGVEYFWDQEEAYDSVAQREESEVGLAWNTKAKLDKITTLKSKLWGRFIEYEKGDASESHFVAGMKNDLLFKFNKNWDARLTLSMFQGGYHGILQETTYMYGKDNVEGFNYEAFARLNYKKDLYKTGLMSI